MNPEKQIFLNLKTPPARLSAEQAAWYLGFELHDIPVLLRKKLLKHLGNAGTNASKHFALIELERLREDSRWLARATDAIHQHWQAKNSKERLPHARTGFSAPEEPPIASIA